MSKKVSASEPLRSPNQYIVDIIAQRKAPSIGIYDYRVKPITALIREWGGAALVDIFPSGSSAKGTALKGNSDLDIFISMSSQTNASVKEIYNSLYKALSKKFVVRKQNVSMRIVYYGLQIDIVPGKKIFGQPHFHYLYPNRRPEQERIQTNINAHVNTVVNSGRINEIIALKIWRQLNKLDFPSMYLELFTISALNGKWSGKSYLAGNFIHTLQEIADHLHSKGLVDPANSSNRISGSLYQYQLTEIRNAASRAVNKTYLSQIIY